MPILLGLLLYAFNIVCILHAIRSGRAGYWLIILVMVPGLGSAAYFIMEWWPELQMSRAGQKVAGNVARTLDPDREFRRRMQELEVADTAENKKALGEELLRRGQFDDAVRCYESALAPPHAGDVALLLGLARARFGAGDPDDALATLDRLQQVEPGFQSREAHLIYARSLETLGRDDEAEAEYRGLVRYAVGPEASVRLALLLQKRGKVEQARAAFGEVVRVYGPRFKALEREDRDWLAVAERNVA